MAPPGSRKHLLDVELADELQVQVAHVLPHARRRLLRRGPLLLQHRRHVAEAGGGLTLCCRHLTESRVNMLRSVHSSRSALNFRSREASLRDVTSCNDSAAGCRPVRICTM